MKPPGRQNVLADLDKSSLEAFLDAANQAALLDRNFVHSEVSVEFFTNCIVDRIVAFLGVARKAGAD